MQVEIEGAEILDELVSACKASQKMIGEAAEETVEETGPDILQAFQQEPGPSSIPKKWTSPKQRRYVWNKISKGEFGSPFPRTHSISQGWNLYAVVDFTESSVILDNQADGIEFVEGDNQQEWHKTTGWINANDLSLEWSEKLADKIWLKIKRKYGRRR